MSEEEKSRCVQHCQSILKAVCSSLNESSKESYKCYGCHSYTLALCVQWVTPMSMKCLLNIMNSTIQIACLTLVGPSKCFGRKKYGLHPRHLK